jgi:[ribosomal protein S5]-alanine N-acetyltransferase
MDMALLGLREAGRMVGTASRPAGPGAIVARAAPAGQTPPSAPAAALWDNRGMTDAPTYRVPVLETARIRLRPYRDDDVEAMFALYSDPRVMRYWSFPAWTERSQAEQYLARAWAAMEAGEIFPWAIADHATDGLIGALTFFSLHREQRRLEVGYSLSPERQGQGLAAEALRCAIGFGFDAVGLVRIEADIDPRNEASAKLLERLGFQREGLLRKRWRVNGEVCDTAFYGLLPDDFVR